MNSPTVTLITGDRGAGKTTVCEKLYRRAVDRGLDVCGIISYAVFDAADRKVGIDAFTISAGTTAPLARKDGSLPGSRWACYSFSDEAFNNCVRATVQALDEGADLLILDEIGPLELAAQKGFLPILRFLEGSQLPHHTVAVVRPSLHERLKRFFAHSRSRPDIRSVCVSADSRDRLLGEMFNSDDQFL